MGNVTSRKSTASAISGSDFRAEIRLLAATLEPGESLREHCPACKGGASRERSLSVHRFADGNLYWNCFRNSCWAGRGVLSSKKAKLLSQNMNAEFSTNKNKGIPPALQKILKGACICPQDVLPSAWYLHGTGTKNALMVPTNQAKLLLPVPSTSSLIIYNQWKYHAGTNALVMPIFGIDGITNGYSTKYLHPKKDSPKSLTWFRDSCIIRISVAKLKKYSRRLVLVEDIPSAVRVSPYINAAALLGTHLDPASAIAIREVWPEITIALDADTWETGDNQGLKIKRDLSCMFEDVRIARLSKDPKCMTNAEVKEEVL